MQSYSYHLFHSAKGTSWKSKDHKYIAIENGRYIYPDDVAKGKSSSAMNSQGSTNRYEQAKQSAQKKLPTAPINSGNVRMGGKTMTPSEYRAQVARKEQITNQDGSIRANSPEARGGTGNLTGDAKNKSTSTGSTGSTRVGTGSTSYGLSQNSYVNHHPGSSGDVRVRQEFTKRNRGFKGGGRSTQLKQAKGISMKEKLEQMKKSNELSSNVRNIASKSINDGRVKELVELGKQLMPNIQMKTR